VTLTCGVRVIALGQSDYHSPQPSQHEAYKDEVV